MRRNRIAALAVTGVAAALLVGSVVIGSNMGFKANLALTGANQDQWVAVPYQGPYSNAQELIDMVLNGSGSVTRFVPSAIPSVQFWDGGSGVNFAHTAGEAYQFRPSGTSGASTIVVGSHDPNQTVPAGGIIQNRDYLISLPYHTTAVNAADILADVPGGIGTVTRLVPAAVSSFQFWDGQSGVNFAYTIGEGVTIRFSSDGPGYLASHF